MIKTSKSIMSALVVMTLVLALVLSSAAAVFAAYKDGTYRVGISCEGGNGNVSVESASVTVIGGTVSYITVTMKDLDCDYCYDPVTGAKVTAPSGSDGRLFYINYPGTQFSFTVHLTKPVPADVTYAVSLDLSSVPEVKDEEPETEPEGGSSEDEAAGRESEEKISAAEELIAGIGNVTIASKEAVKAAREAVNALSSEEKQGLDNLDVLEAAEKALEAIEKKIADADALIEKIGDDIGLESESDIKAAREAVDALTADEAGELKNLTKLQSAEDIFKELKEAAGKEAAEKAKKRETMSYIAAGAVIVMALTVVVLINLGKRKKQKL